MPEGNAASCVLLVEVGEFKALLSGDIESETEAQLVRQRILPKVDVVDLDLERALEPVLPAAQRRQQRHVLRRQRVRPRAEHVGCFSLVDQDAGLTLAADQLGAVLDLVVLVREPPDQRVVGVVEPLDDVDQLALDETHDAHGVAVPVRDWLLAAWRCYFVTGCASRRARSEFTVFSSS